MKQLRTLFIAAALVLASTNFSFAQPCQYIVHAYQEKAVDNFIYLVDNSGSMMMMNKEKNMRKMELAQHIMANLGAYIPKYDYTASMGLFSPDKTLVAPTTWDENLFLSAISSINTHAPIFGRLTDFTKSTIELNTLTNSLSGETAIFLISDGLDNIGMPPVQAMANFYNTNPNVVVHVISIADTEEGKSNLMEIAELNSDSIYVDGFELLANPAMNKEIVDTVFRGVLAPSNMSVCIDNPILFAVASYAVEPKFQPYLDDIAEVLSTQPELSFLIEGFASPTGNVAKNRVLAENRAKSVRDYLIRHGVNPSQLIAQGLGVTDGFGENPEDRRVEIRPINK